MRSPRCMDMIGEIKQVPGADELCELIESFNFGDAEQILVALKETMK